MKVKVTNVIRMPRKTNNGKYNLYKIMIDKDITLAKLVNNIQDMSLNLGIEIEAKLRNVLYLLQDIDDDKAKKAFKIIDDLIY